MTAREQRNGNGDFEISLEITPPRSPKRGVLLRRAKMLGRSASSVHVIQRPDRQSSLDASRELLAAGVRPTWHLVCRGRTPQELRGDIEAAADAGIDRMLVIRGDRPATEAPSGAGRVDPRIREVVAWIRSAAPTARVAVTLNQYAPREPALRNLAGKLGAGAVRVQTQPVFDFEVYRGAAERARELAPEVELQPMLIPLVDAEELERLGTRLGVPIPEPLSARLRAGGSEAGWSAFVEQAKRLRASGLADALAIMTLAADPPGPFLERLRAAVDEVLS